MRPHGRLPYAGNFHFHSILNKIWLLLFGYSEMGKPMVEENFEQARNSSKMSMADSERATALTEIPTTTGLQLLAVKREEMITTVKKLREDAKTMSLLIFETASSNFDSSSVSPTDLAACTSY
ncbi:hypothetical protein PS2_000105 [Malus domestica]